jgi:hypothetical protein
MNRYYTKAIFSQNCFIYALFSYSFDKKNVFLINLKKFDKIKKKLIKFKKKEIL